MLGPTMPYTCGYWREARTLDEAQNTNTADVQEALPASRHARSG
jgi:cyclopropane fatty-acyl-phospholipid synthase-like methyltransferase